MHNISTNYDTNTNLLEQAYTIASNVVTKDYLKSLTKYPISTNDLIDNNTDSIRLYKINRLVYKKDEDILLKLSTVYNSIASTGSGIIFIIDSKNADEQSIDFYVGVKNIYDLNFLNSGRKALEKAFIGNFNGSILEEISSNTIKNLSADIFRVDKTPSNTVSAVSGVAKIRNKEKTENKIFVQGIEKFIDAMKGSVYTAVFIADILSNDDVKNIQLGYEKLFSTILPFSKCQYTFNKSDSESISESLSNGIFNSVTNGTSLTQSHTKSHSDGAFSSNTSGGSFSIGGIFGSHMGFSSSSSHTSGKSQTTTEGNSTSKGTSNSSTQGENETQTTGKSIQSTTGKSIQIEYVDKTTSNLLERIEMQLKRLNESEDYGMFNCSSYFLSTDKQTSVIAANTYKALIIGEESSVEATVVNTWSKKEDVELLTKYLQKFMHPIINVETVSGEFLPYTTGSIVSGLELPLHLGLPQKSVAGLPLIEYAEFGRNVFRDEESENKFSLGSIYHMGSDEKTSVDIDVESLSMHTFITGSTGSGKSNTIYKMLYELRKKQISFLVIEPAKGEYKNMFGSYDDVHIFGTNFHKTPLLNINPFKFPDDILVIEHIDRLIEIFNVCWPMYAAMPAVLKDAVERAYKSAGWDLEMSENKYIEKLYPTFSDVLLELNEVISESSFSQEVKDNYTGALITRVKSLTNGINGQIFSADEIDNKILFDSNTIIDLSRVGSVETKAMIMGILVMRLQEYRMSQGGMNLPLKHVTVIEEAHNLLPKVSTEQVSEVANLRGKSVEMLANTISEVRTYGEGFIIADQSPDKLDLSVIRNTNTKIILRLPDMNDRNLVGKSANLNDEQIIELAKLSRGVAAIYQNDWIMPVLCHIQKSELEEKEYINNNNYSKQPKNLRKEIVRYLLADIIKDNIEWDIDYLNQIKEYIMNSNYCVKLKLDLIDSINNKPVELKEVSSIIDKLFDGNTILKNVRKADNIDEWNSEIIEILDPVKELDPCYHNIIMQCIVKENLDSDNYNKWFETTKDKIL